MGDFFSLLQPITDFIFPPTCVHCRTVLEEDDRHLCRSCWKAIPLLSAETGLYQETRARLLSAGGVDELVSVYVFEKDGPFQAIAHALKYEGFQSAGRMVGGALGEQMIEWGVRADVILPVPLHRAKHRERGFNQAESIARGIADRTRWPVVTDVLVRTRSTKTQTKLDAAERRKNVEGAFAVPEGKSEGLQNRTCIVVDDVITTGATILACARVLRSSGASSIIAASAALAK